MLIEKQTDDPQNVWSGVSSWCEPKRRPRCFPSRSRRLEREVFWLKEQAGREDWETDPGLAL